MPCDNLKRGSPLVFSRLILYGPSLQNPAPDGHMCLIHPTRGECKIFRSAIDSPRLSLQKRGICTWGHGLFNADLPFLRSLNPSQIYRKVTSQIPPSALDRVQNYRAREFIRVCLSPDPDERPSAMDLLNHAFLKDKNEEEVRITLDATPSAVEVEFLPFGLCGVSSRLTARI